MWLVYLEEILFALHDLRTQPFRQEVSVIMRILVILCISSCSELCIYDVHGNSMVHTLDPKTVTTLDFKSRTDLKIRFTDKLNKTQIIAECDTHLNTCYMLTHSLGKYYSVSYTGEGAMLNIVKVTGKTLGTYSFCENLILTSCVSTEIVDITATDTSNSDNSSEHIDNNRGVENVCCQSQTYVGSLGAVQAVHLAISVLIGVFIIWEKFSIKGRLCRRFRKKSQKTIRKEEDIRTDMLMLA
ncbi:uncharacterized protein LOC127836396 isoform X2 [Dreissena polymorpha]|uniref:uncharacterized protein LOC127836396 isoform X2 n=1 Tax=Dreissena polymorpha TaxID=45954 RepID=UPI00226468EC|nr:uncharacterized protein LOC127836396 isoform X2 [Dreissena polymorpha]